MDKSGFLEQVRWMIIFGAVVSAGLIVVGGASLAFTLLTR